MSPLLASADEDAMSDDDLQVQSCNKIRYIFIIYKCNMKPQYLAVIHLEILLNKSRSLKDTPYINLCDNCVTTAWDLTSSSFIWIL